VLLFFFRPAKAAPARTTAPKQHVSA
jgi:hypothetical protein